MLGFEFKSSSEVLVLQNFFEGLQIQIDYFMKSEALMRGANFYQQLHKDHMKKVDEQLKQKKDASRNNYLSRNHTTEERIEKSKNTQG